MIYQNKGNSLIRAGCYLILIGSPWIRGGNLPQIRLIFSFIVYLLLLFHFIINWRDSRLKKDVNFLYSLPGIAFIVGILIVLFQIIPLPEWFLGILSPSSLKIWKKYSPIEEIKTAFAIKSSISPSNTISITPYITGNNLLLLLAYSIWSYLIYSFFKTRTQIKRLVKIIIFIGLLEVLLAYTQKIFEAEHMYIFFRGGEGEYPFTGSFINPNHFAAYLNLITPIALALIVYKIYRYHERIGSIRSFFSYFMDTKEIGISFPFWSLLLMSGGIFLSLSRGGIVAYGFSLFLFSLVFSLGFSYERKKSLLVFSTISFILIIFLSWMGLEPVVKELETLKKEFSSPNLSTRLVLSLESLRVWQDFPVFGSGLGSFAYIYPSYRTIKGSLIFLHAHNDLVQVLVEVGLIGFISFLLPSLFILKRLMSLSINNKLPGDSRFLKIILIGIVTALLTTFLYAFLEFHLQTPAIAILALTLMGMGLRIVRFPRAKRRISKRISNRG